MIFGILFGAMVFNSFVTATTIPLHVVNFVTDSAFRHGRAMLVLLVYFSWHDPRCLV